MPHGPISQFPLGVEVPWGGCSTAIGIQRWVRFVEPGQEPGAPGIHSFSWSPFMGLGSQLSLQLQIKLTTGERVVRERDILVD